LHEIVQTEGVTFFVTPFVTLFVTKREGCFAILLTTKETVQVSKLITVSLTQGDTMKRKFLFSTISLLLLIVLASTALAALAAGPRQFHLKGSLTAIETQEVNFPIALIDLTGTGNATHLGRYTVHLQAELNLLTLSGTGTGTLVAADGSTLFLEGSGQGTLMEDPMFVSIVETYTITGGTGRFAGATGNVTIERVINRETKISSGTISGMIVLP
jgi:hypothetical protein